MPDHTKPTHGVSMIGIVYCTRCEVANEYEENMELEVRCAACGATLLYRNPYSKKGVSVSDFYSVKHDGFYGYLDDNSSKG